mgnify:CR=1 FL=1
MKHSFKSIIKKTSMAISIATLTTGAMVVQAADTIKVGVLHSLSGTMAISETTLKDTEKNFFILKKNLHTFLSLGVSGNCMVTQEYSIAKYMMQTS